MHVAAVVAAADLTLYNGWLVENTYRDVLYSLLL